MFTRIKKNRILDSEYVILLNNKFDGEKVETIHITKLLKES